MANHRGDEEITSSDDYIDSRDVIARIAYLESELEPHDDPEDDTELDADEVEAYREELSKLKELAAEGEGYADWNYGAQLIKDEVFEDYAREYAEDVHGSAVSEAAWPFDNIDWEAAADALRVDYSEIEFDGATYLIR